jgi:hypothetical protein
MSSYLELVANELNAQKSVYGDVSIDVKKRTITTSKDDSFLETKDFIGGFFPFVEKIWKYRGQTKIRFTEEIYAFEQRVEKDRDRDLMFICSYMNKQLSAITGKKIIGGLFPIRSLFRIFIDDKYAAHVERVLHDLHVSKKYDFTVGVKRDDIVGGGFIVEVKDGN